LEWKRDKWGKAAKWFLKLSEKLAVKYADVVVADNAVIQEYVMSEYVVRSELIAYGADHVTKEVLSNELKAKYPFLNEPYAFKVCRIEPENNVHLILEAFSEYKVLNLVMIGNWENSDYGKELKTKYSSFGNIFLLDPIYDQQVLNQIRSNCFVYMHGHSAGGTNPSLVEAMYFGLPIFAYGVEYNKATTQNEAKFFNDKDELLELLGNIDKNDIQNIATEMKKIAEENYTWGKISEQYAKLF
jgi:glycosyltransferase involved in cell wall biosynthesis